MINFDIEKYNIQVGGGLYQYLNYECLLNLLKFGKNKVENNNFYIITSLISDEYVFLFLNVNQKNFILVQKFSIDMIIDITSNKINVLSKVSKEHVNIALRILGQKINFLITQGVDFYGKFSIDYRNLNTSQKILFLIATLDLGIIFKTFCINFLL